MITTHPEIGWRFGRMASVGLSLLLLMPPFPVLSQEESDFTGRWQRNEEESDDPQAKLRAAMEQMRQDGGSGRGGGGREGRQGMQFGMRELMQAAKTLDLKLSGDELQVRDGTERVRIYYLDSEKHARETPNGQKVEARAERRGDQILIEEKMARATINHSIALGPEGNVMVWTMTLDNNRFKEPVIIRSVYGLAER